MGSRGIEIFASNPDIDGYMGLEVDPLVVKLTIGERAPVWYEAGNIYALESWRRMGSGSDLEEEIAGDGFVSHGLYKTIAEARGGYEGLLEKYGPPSTTQMVEEQESVIEATARAMVELMATVIQASGVSVEQQVAITQEIKHRSQPEVFMPSVVRALEDLQMEVLDALFISGDLDNKAQDFLDTYDECLRGPYVSDETNYQVHEPRQRISVEDCLEGLRAVLQYADSHHDDSLSDYQRGIVEEILGRTAHDFQPHWLDSLKAEGLRVGWAPSNIHQSHRLDIPYDSDSSPVGQ